MQPIPGERAQSATEMIAHASSSEESIGANVWFAIRSVRHGEVDDPPPIMGEHHENEEYAKRGCRNREEVNRPEDHPARVGLRHASRRLVAAPTRL